MRLGVTGIRYGARTALVLTEYGATTDREHGATTKREYGATTVREYGAMTALVLTYGMVLRVGADAIAELEARQSQMMEEDMLPTTQVPIRLCTRPTHTLYSGSTCLCTPYAHAVPNPYLPMHTRYARATRSPYLPMCPPYAHATPPLVLRRLRWLPRVCTFATPHSASSRAHVVLTRRMRGTQGVFRSQSNEELIEHIRRQEEEISALLKFQVGPRACYRKPSTDGTECAVLAEHMVLRKAWY